MSECFDGNMEQRFLSYVEKTDSCWLWTGGKCKVGYGQYWRPADKQVLAHRHSYEIYKGKIPNGLVVRHTCDNPSCVNPNHLIVGTYKENSKDMVDRNRSVKGSKNKASKLTEDDVREIRILIDFGFLHRELAKMYGVCCETIARVRRRELWKHIT
jgi:hypothetical protein